MTLTRPDWKRAPKWARFAAMDRHGGWWWFESEPVVSEGTGMFTASGFNTEAAIIEGWMNTAHARPSQDGEPLPPPRDKTPVYRLTNAAGEHTFKDFHDAGWTNELLLANGYAEIVK